MPRMLRWQGFPGPFDAAQSAGRRGATNALMAPHRSSALRILVAAGDRALSRRMFEHLGRHGHALDSALDGPTALHLALVHDYDAIVLDAALPQLDGYAVCRHLREATRHDVPVFMLTAPGTETSADLSCGADEYLRKPVALTELDKRLTAAVRRLREPALDYDASCGALDT